MKIAFYLNLQGSGHCRRFEALARHFPPDCELAVVGMDGPPAIANVNRPVERVSVPSYGPPPTNPFLQQQTSRDYHDFLVNSGNNSPFTMAMVTFLSRWQPDLVVSDVGLEASILARMCGIPVVYSRQHGSRWDKGHRLAYEWACSLWAPFAAEMEQADCPDWIREKTFYSGGFCRFSGRKKEAIAPSSYTQTKPNILVMTGFGGTAITPQKLAAAAAATPEWQWHLLGAHTAGKTVCAQGVVEDVWPYLCHADLVIANAGHNSTMEIAAAGASAVFIPAERPFNEQLCKVNVLRNLELGIVASVWPKPWEWARLREQAHAQDLSKWQHLQDANAPRRAAQHITQITKKCMVPTPQVLQPVTALPNIPRAV